MSRKSYPYSTAPASRHITTTHGTSSAFSSSANPDEDWTKISDLAERRRIQNRIAQRNYRKKLKRRLEDLERRAGSSSASPPQTPAEISQSTRPGESRQQYKRSPESRQPQPSPRLLPSQFTPPMQAEDEGIFANGFERDGSRTPPLFANHTYPAPEDVMYPPYAQPYRPMSTAGDWTGPDTDYLAPVPVRLPSMMQSHDSVKREYEDTLTPFSLSYQGLPPAVDIRAHHGYGDSNPHTPPLSHPYDHSSCSESGYQYPTTLLSMPTSPPIMTQI